jgi:hypothetical protein
MMLSAQAAIHRYQRDVALGYLLRSLLLVGCVLSVFVLPLVLEGFDRAVGLSVLLGVWMVLTLTSAKNSRLLAPSPELIASGQYEEAERRIDESLRAFSISRTSKLLGLHHLAALRHRQRRWQESATLCRAVLSQRLPGGEPLGRSSRLMLADALLELGDVRGAGEAIDGLRGQQLGLSELLTMLQVELDHQSRSGAWDRMLAGLPTKVQLAETMPAPAAARVQALLALAAHKGGRPDWSDWLRRRVELLADVGKLTAERPVLWELWKRSDA